MNWVVAIGAAVGAIGGVGGIAALLQAIFGRSKMKADATAVITAAAGGFVADVREERDADRAAWEAERHRLEARIVSLEEQIDLQRSRSREARQSLEGELDGLRIRVRDLERLAADLERQGEEKDATILRLSNDLRH